MVKRLFNPLKSHSFIVLGARGTGKSTWLKENLSTSHTNWIDLLDPSLEQKYSLDPSALLHELSSLTPVPDWVVIDEIQKVPKLLDVVHKLIEQNGMKFALSGSSARKLKRGAANLLAGRAFVYHLYPLSLLEVPADDLQEILRWGLFPQLMRYKTDREKKSFLNSYVQTYFAEEIRAEQIVRKLDPFRAFLPVLGQVSGKVINHNRIAKEIGVSSVTVQSYFQIIEDTLMGFYLPAFHQSVRKSQRQSPKFYLIDTGVKKALEGSLDQLPLPQTAVFGELFEALVVSEVVKLNSYFEKDFRLSFFATTHSEIDLILTKNQRNYAIEIKSKNAVTAQDLESLERKARAIPNLERLLLLSNDTAPKRLGRVEAQPWREFLKSFQGL